MVTLKLRGGSGLRARHALKETPSGCSLGPASSATHWGEDWEDRSWFPWGQGELQSTAGGPGEDEMLQQQHRETRTRGYQSSEQCVFLGMCLHGDTTMHNLISLLFCPLRELPGILTSARAGSLSRAQQSSLAERPQ